MLSCEDEDRKLDTTKRGKETVLRGWTENLIVNLGLALACDYILGFICK